MELQSQAQAQTQTQTDDSRALGEPIKFILASRQSRALSLLLAFSPSLPRRPTPSLCLALPACQPTSLPQPAGLLATLLPRSSRKRYLCTYASRHASRYAYRHADRVLTLLSSFALERRRLAFPLPGDTRERPRSVNISTCTAAPHRGRENLDIETAVAASSQTRLAMAVEGGTARGEVKGGQDGRKREEPHC